MSLRPARALLPPSDPSPAAAGPTLAPSQRLGPHAHVVRVDVLLEAEEVNGTHRMYHRPASPQARVAAPHACVNGCPRHAYEGYAVQAVARHLSPDG